MVLFPLGTFDMGTFIKYIRIIFGILDYRVISQSNPACGSRLRERERI